MKELDVLLERFLACGYDTARADEQTAFQALLELPDPTLLDLLTGRAITPDRASRVVIERLRASH